MIKVTPSRVTVGVPLKLLPKINIRLLEELAS
jgi:hypothetical protein